MDTLRTLITVTTGILIGAIATKVGRVVVSVTENANKENKNG